MTMTDPLGAGAPQPSPVAPTRASGGLLAVLTVCCLVWPLASPAAGHAVLVGSQPQDGETVTEELDEVRLRFNEPVRPLEVSVVDPDGASVAQGDPRELGDTVEQLLVPLTVEGRYTVSFRVISADDHPVSGELSFVFSGPAATPDPTPPPAATEEPTAPGPAPLADEAAAPAARGEPEAPLAGQSGASLRRPTGLGALAALAVAVTVAAWYALGRRGGRPPAGRGG